MGAGPAGLMTAGELALAGVAVEVIERRATPSGQSRVGGVNPRTSEVLAMRGLLDVVTERAIPTESAGWHFAGLPVALDARPWRTRYPDGLFIPQDRLEEVLEAHLGGTWRAPVVPDAGARQCGPGCRAGHRVARGHH
ncbi:MAG: FAD-dependent monooxygenase [Pseudonocardiaceae bacterium]